ncbi:basic membrane lipoprotein Med (substrate-binding protein (PBP1-ABC) superfamily) [Mycoplana sp. BE70]|uniref:BMP family protein n=1 Tax=Mycoplana sp. BE70 TaxID=2817775 RepID=UPI00285AEE47|nr:BMP family protein [Mycoplana sp. BE70]MDR6755128.1 basic membrane lipoprotein Med (substrate-binding protein (PBP1-ABC) superfamily) [Mycoplana sp. BE70]
MNKTRRELLTLTALGLGAWATGLPAARAATPSPRIRAIFETPMEEPFVTQLHLAMSRIAKEANLDYKYSESVKAADFSRVLRQWCEEGIELIVGDAYGTEQACRRVAGSYSETAFTLGSAMGPTGPNVSTFYGQNYEAAYLGGMLAAGLSKSGKIGVVSGIAVPTTYGLLNAYRAGAKEMKPDIQMKAAYIGSMFDPPKAKEATIAMADLGVDVVFAERIGVIEAATERQMIAIGNMTDQSAINPATVVSSVIWDPYPIIKASVDAVMSGTLIAKDYSTIENVANGVNYLASYKEFEDKVPAELKAAIEAKSKEIASGAFTVAYDTNETKSD